MCHSLLSLTRIPPRPTLFPYTTLFRSSGPEVEAEIAATKTAWSSEVNFESSQPPLYYALASVWWRIGRKAGLAGIQSLYRSEEHTSELQSHSDLVCRLLLEKKKKTDST